MPTIQYGSKSITVPDGLTDEQQMQLVLDESEGVKAPSTSNPMPTNIPFDYSKEKIDPATLVKDPMWQNSSRVVYRMHHGVDFDGTEQQLADYGLNQMSAYKYNTLGAIWDASALKFAHDDEKKAWLYLNDTHEKLGLSLAGAGRFIAATAADPMTYFGLASLGIGWAGAKATDTVAKAAIRAAIVASIEGGVQGAGMGEINQQAMVNSGRQTETDQWEVAKESAIGAGGGLVLGGLLGAGAKKLAQYFPKDKSGLAAGAGQDAAKAAEKKAGGKATLEDGEFAVDFGSPMEKGQKQERAGAMLDEHYNPVMPKDATEAEKGILYRLHVDAKDAGEAIDLEQQLKNIRESYKPEPREVQVGDENFKLDDSKPQDVDYKGLKVTEDEKIALEAIEKKAEAEAPPVVDNRPKAEAYLKQHHPTFEHDHWKNSWKDVSDDAAHPNAPDWFPKVRDTVRDMAHALGMAEPGFYHGDPLEFGTGGSAWRHGHIAIARVSSPEKALADAMHELGHQMEFAVLWHSPPDVRDALTAAWQTHMKIYGKGRTWLQHRPLSMSFWDKKTYGDRIVDESKLAPDDKYVTKFSEWFAEQVQRALTTQKEPSTVIEKFFSGIIEKWKLIYQKVTGKIPLHPEVAKFIRDNWHGDLIAQAGPKVNLDEELTKLRAGGNTYDAHLNNVQFMGTDPVEKIISTIKGISPEEGLKFETHGRKQLDTESLIPAHILVNMTKAGVIDLVKNLATKAVTPEQALRLSSAFRVATNQLEAKAFNLWAEYKLIEDPVAKAQAWKELAMVEKLRDNIKEGDTYLSSMQGSALSQRVGSINTGEMRGVSVDSILTELHGDPQLIKDLAAKGDVSAQKKLDDAMTEYYRKVSNYYERAAASVKVKDIQARVRELHDQIQKNGGEGDWEAIGKLMEQLKEEQLKAAVNNSAEFKLFGPGSGKKIINDVNRLIISTVFSPATLTVNTIPSLVKTVAFPALNALMKGPTDEAAVKEMLTFYHTMYNNIGVSWQMAKAAWALERSLMMTQDYGNRFMEGAKGTGYLDNRFGRYVGVFPRLLTATDEFFQSLNYRGYHMAEAHYAAIRDANEAMKGGHMTAADKEAYVTKKLQEAAMNMFSSEQDAGKVLEWTYEVGREQGYKGQALHDWVKGQIKERGHLMKEASSETGARYVEDLLFKRRFSGENLPSSGFKWLDTATNENPWMRTLGQLFVRTPVRVFEEVVRMTPGLNLFAPNFLNDLRGLNGQPAQVKAMRESMIGFTLTHWAMAQYAAGNLTGGGPSDYKRRRDMEAAGWKPFTLKVGGKEINFRNQDPFFGPVKIVATMMERLEELQVQKKHGTIEPGSWDDAMGLFGVTAGAFMKAITDSNLWDGVNQGLTAMEKSANPNHKGFDNFFVHFFGPKAAYIVPSVVSKGMGMENTQKADPASVWQYVEAKFNANSTSVAHIHDVLGNVMVNSNPLGRITGIDIDDKAMRQAGRSDKEMAVAKEIAKLGISQKTNFQMPTKDKYLPGVPDLRTTMTQDGKNTLYDRVNQHLKERNLTDQLYGILTNPKASDAIKTQAARKVISQNRVAAFQRLWREEKGLKDDFVARSIVNAHTKAGKFDTEAVPYFND